MSREESQGRRTTYILSAIFLFSLWLFLSGLPMGFGYTIGPNYRNISVDTRVNITNAGPEIFQVLIEDPITLVAGSSRQVLCNVSLRDYNGFADISNVNGTLFHNSVGLGDADDNNTHYYNASCEAIDEDGFYANYTCTFNVWYYANDGIWNCSIGVNDSYDFTEQVYNNTDINMLYALNVSPLIDYGNLAIEATSNNITANVTNLGNVPINISVYGYGNESGDGLSFLCQYGNISIGKQKFAANITADYDTKVNLTSTGQSIPHLTVAKQTTAPGLQVNTTYWQLYVPPNPFGECNGTVVFQAETSI